MNACSTDNAQNRAAHRAEAISVLDRHHLSKQYKAAGPMLLLVSLGWLSFPATVPSAPSGSGQGSMVFLPQEPASPSGEPEPAVLVRHPAPPPERASASTPSNEIEITGTVVIESADGAECLPSSATLTLQLWPGPASQDAAVAAGAWRIRVPEHTRWLLIQRLIVDGRSAGVDDHKLEVDERRHFAIRARWLSPMRRWRD
ncbi:MAG: hypothetical protein U1E76_15430 [Planctomycetota bacterium]